MTLHMERTKEISPLDKREIGILHELVRNQRTAMREKLIGLFKQSSDTPMLNEQIKGADEYGEQLADISEKLYILQKEQ